MSLPAVIMLGVDSPTGLAIMRELGREGVPVHAIGSDPRSIGEASRYCTRFWLRGAGAHADWLPGIIAESGAEALIAWSEGDLVALADLPGEIGGCRILTPRCAALDLALDKARTLALARQVGIETPRLWDATPGEWPVVVKWANPIEARPLLDAAGLEFVKAEFCRDAAELDAVLARYRALPVRPLVQSYAAGRGIGQMFHIERGMPTLAFQHERLHEWPPEGGVSTLCRSLPPDVHAAQRALSVKLLQAMDWQGPAMVEYRWDAQRDRYLLMEVNGRFWGSQPLATASGARFGWELYRRAMLADSTPPPAYRAGLVARYMIPETRRLVRLLFRRRAIADPFFKPRPLRDLWRYIAGFASPRSRYYVWAIDDPRPFLRDIANVVRKGDARSERPAPPVPPPSSPAPGRSHNKAPTA